MIGPVERRHRLSLVRLEKNFLELVTHHGTFLWRYWDVDNKLLELWAWDKIYQNIPYDWAFIEKTDDAVALAGLC